MNWRHCRADFVLPMNWRQSKVKAMFCLARQCEHLLGHTSQMAFGNFEWRQNNLFMANGTCPKQATKQGRNSVAARTLFFWSSSPCFARIHWPIEWMIPLKIPSFSVFKRVNTDFYALLIFLALIFVATSCLLHATDPSFLPFAADSSFKMPSPANSRTLLALRPLLMLLPLVALLSQQPSGFGPGSPCANALPVSMLHWNSLANFYPFNGLFRSSSGTSTQREEEQPRVALIVVKSHRRHAEREEPLVEAETRQREQQHQKQQLPSAATKPQRKFGTLKLCPPGGRSFFEAFELACPMKKRKKRHVMFGLGSRVRAEPPRMRKYHPDSEELREPEKPEEPRQQRPADGGEEAYRPANISEIMRICCVSGCEFSDFFPHCGPFSMW